MLQAETKFSLLSADGESHSYRVTPLRPSENIDLALELVALIAEPGMRLVQLGIEANGVDTEIGDLLKSVDLSGLGKDVAATARALASRPKVVFRFFAGAIRDEKDLTVTNAFDAAYTANYGELVRALSKIIELNGFLGFLDSLRS